MKLLRKYDMKKLILTMAAIAIVGCSPPTNTPQQACAYYEDNFCDQSRDNFPNKSWPFVSWYCSDVGSMCEDFRDKSSKERLALITNQLNSDQVLRSIVQQSIKLGVKCNEYSDSAYCLAIDMRSKQLSEVIISSSEYQQVMSDINAQINENNAQAKANQDALKILKKAESNELY